MRAQKYDKQPKGGKFFDFIENINEIRSSFDRMKLLTDIKPLLNGPRQRIVITMHQRPDADAMGSSLACYDYLKQKGHDVQREESAGDEQSGAMDLVCVRALRIKRPRP